jgi:hypothetical protein
VGAAGLGGCVRRGSPFGEESWCDRMVRRLGLEGTLRPQGRPRKCEKRFLTPRLIAGKAIPASEPRDAFHIAIAAVHGIDYLLTWNFKHIANASLRHRIEQVCRDAGFEPPIICTPDELTGADDDS